MYRCPICHKSVSDNCNSIQCDICDLWVHQNKCSGLNREEFQLLSEENNNDNWYCPCCINNALPLPAEESTQEPDTAGPGLNENLKSILSDLNDIVSGVTESDNDENFDELQFQSNTCSYTTCDEFNSLLSHKTEGISAFHLNISSISKHFDKLQTLLSQLNINFNFIGISETRNTTDDENLAPSTEREHDFPLINYKKFFTPTESSAGGVSLYISKSLVPVPRKDLDSICYQSKNLESVFVEIPRPAQTNLVVGTIYRHPCMSIDTFNSDFLKPLVHKLSKEKKQILLLGDFNINLLKCDDEPVNSFLDILGSNLLVPHILLPTRVTDHSKTLIDNIFSGPAKSMSISGNLCYSISDHLPQFCLFPELEYNKIKDCGPFLKQNWSKFDKDNFIKDYTSINWDSLFDSFDLDPDKCFNVFNDKMKVLVQRHVPTVKLTKREVESKLKPWITPGLIKSMSKRDFYQRKSLKSKSKASADHFDNLYRTYRNQIVNLSKQSKTNYYTRYFQRYSKNMKKVWSGIRDIISTKEQKNTNISISIDGQVHSEPGKVANHFNDFFTSIADNIRDKIPPSYQHYSSFLKHRNQNSIFLRPSSSDEVAKIIGAFSSSKSSGPNSIPIKILKLLQDKISKPLSSLINRSFMTGVFPNVLKISKVIPVFKNKGSPLEVSNYRPISLLSNIEKIYEKIMYSRVMEFFNQSNQIYARQFGFRKGHSTSHILTNILERIREHLDSGGFACGVFVDLQKAFDTVDHEILLSKLDHYGIRGTTKVWFESYLSDRSQYVSISGTKSKLKPIKHGVPQGSVLGPLLFLVYINDLHHCIRTSETYHFADDTHLLNLSQTVWSLCGRVNSDLRVLVSWLNANKISLNASKTEFIIFRSNRRPLDTIPRIEISGKRLTPSKTIKYLGVHLDEHLTWKQHVAVVAAKLRRANGAISKLRYYLPLPNLINVYHAIFSSHIRYACQTWGLCDNTITHRIQVLQNTAIRLMTFQGPRASVTLTYSELKILKFFDLVETLNIMFIYRYLNRYLPSDCLSTFTFSVIPHDIGTRANHISLLFVTNVNTTTFGLHSLTRLASRQWNNLQEHLDDQNLQIIEPLDLVSHIRKFYLNKYAPQVPPQEQ